MGARKPSGFWGSLKRVYAILHPGHRRDIGLVALLTLFGTLAEIATIGLVVSFLALLSGASPASVPWLDSVLEGIAQPSRGGQLVVALAALCIAAIAAAVVRIMLLRSTQKLVFSFGHRLSVELQRRALFQPFAWHVRHNSSEQLATIEKAECVTTGVLLPLAQASAASVLIAGVSIFLLQIAPLSTVIAGLALGAAYFTIAQVVRNRLESNSRRLDRAFERRIRILQEGLGGIRDVILDGSQAQVLEEFRRADLELALARANSSVVVSVPRFLIESAGIVVLAGVALLLSERPGGLAEALPTLGALALGAQRLLPLIQQLYSAWSNVAANKLVLEDVANRLELPVAERKAAGKLRFESQIEFRNVSYTYAERGQPAVSDVSFTIHRGRRVALMGPTGSGKSTPADLLMGLLEPTSGSILIDGVSLLGENLQQWRANVAHVPQSPFVADASFARNIALSRDFDLQRIRNAARDAQLDGFIDSLPNGYETPVGERGARMSGGQLQRLAIARAIYKNVPLLLLDEATSGLDTETEAALLSALDRLQDQGRTIVIISHRSTTVARCDLVVRLEHGRVGEIAKTA